MITAFRTSCVRRRRLCEFVRACVRGQRGEGRDGVNTERAVVSHTWSQDHSTCSGAPGSAWTSPSRCVTVRHAAHVAAPRTLRTISGSTNDMARPPASTTAAVTCTAPAQHTGQHCMLRVADKRGRQQRCLPRRRHTPTVGASAPKAPVTHQQGNAALAFVHHGTVSTLGLPHAARQPRTTLPGEQIRRRCGCRKPADSRNRCVGFKPG